MDDLLRIFALVALIGGNAFFVIGEYAIVTARRGALRARGSTGAQRDLLGDWLPSWAGFLLAFAIVTYLSVVLGELVPRRSRSSAPRRSRCSSRGRSSCSRGSCARSLLLRPFGISDVMVGESVRSADELRARVDEAEGSGVIPRAQEELLHNVFDFPGREARDVMVPALDVAWLEASLIPEAALSRVVETPHARYPVGNETLDSLVGVVRVRDLLAARGAAVREVARPAFVIPRPRTSARCCGSCASSARRWPS